MIFGSAFTGIGGIDRGLILAGMQCEWQIEIDLQCHKILNRHYPEVEKFYDVRCCGKENLKPVDLIAGGFPCQDLSVAGKRAGLIGERSGLWFEFERIIDELGPKWIVVENVPGLLSNKEGMDFATILRRLVECGYGVAWRVFDAQYFGVPQQRRRVFIVGHLGDGCAAEVLFEREGLCWNSSACGEEWQEVAAPLKANSPSRRNGGSNPIINEFVIARALRSRSLSNGHISGRGGEDDFDLISYSISTQPGKRLSAEDNYVVWDKQQITRPLNGTRITPGLSRTLNQNGAMMVGVRRLTPLECERLQGFPDGYTEGQSDTARYRQLGNSVAIPVIEWIGRRIMDAENARLCR